jgi:hypothetical protein
VACAFTPNQTKLNPDSFDQIFFDRIYKFTSLYFFHFRFVAELNGTPQRVCGSTGEWSGTAATCESRAADVCFPDLTPPLDGSVDRTFGAPGVVATFSCNEGFYIYNDADGGNVDSGIVQSTCEAGSIGQAPQWSGTPIFSIGIDLAGHGGVDVGGNSDNGVDVGGNSDKGGGGGGSGSGGSRRMLLSGPPVQCIPQKCAPSLSTLVPALADGGAYWRRVYMTSFESYLLTCTQLFITALLSLNNNFTAALLCE